MNLSWKIEGLKTFSPREVFDILPLDRMQLQEPRKGCTARAQIIVDWLDANNFVSGRIWALPAQGTEFFNSPTRGLDGEYLTSPHIDEAGHHPRLTWRCHVAATAQTDAGLVVFDPTLFDGPVDAKIWESLFTAQGANVKALKSYEAPIYGAFGSCYAPGLAEEHTIDDSQKADVELNQIKTSKDPTPLYRPSHAPPVIGRLLRKNR